MAAYNSMPKGQLDFAGALIVYIYVGGIGLAFAGFSFLNRRADSDFYHSLPVSRRDLYLSVTAAALTWIVGTVLFCVLSVTVVHIAMGAGFVPLYPLMNFLYYTAGAALVFAAAAIAMKNGAIGRRNRSSAKNTSTFSAVPPIMIAGTASPRRRPHASRAAAPRATTASS